MARRTRRKVSRVKTRKHRKGSVLDVKSAGAVKAFEKLISKGTTIVFVYLKTCGPCHQFRNEVWNPLINTKNKSMNMASVDSEVIGQTSLGSVPRKFYPTIMLVGKDKKPATFTDEDGQPTNSMPRANTLSEDRKVLSTLIKTPNPTINSAPSEFSMIGRDSMPRNASASIGRSSSSLGKSPFESKSPVPSDSEINETMNDTMDGMPSMSRPSTDAPRTVSVPDIGSDLVASQTRSTTGTAGVLSVRKGGRMLESIRNKTASLKAMLGLRKQHTRRSN